MTPHWQLAADTPFPAEQVRKQDWLWVPGWSYCADIFAPLMASLPGRHWACDYLCKESSLTAMATRLAACAAEKSPSNAIWVGWSLGGVLALEAANLMNQEMEEGERPARIVTLGCGRRFIADHPGEGMPESDFRAFSEAFSQDPQATLKRFNALCARGADQPRSLIKSLAASQLNAADELEHTLRWLNYPAISDQAPYAHHVYGQNDALSPTGLTPAIDSPGNSHAFFLTDAGHTQLVELLTRLAGDLNGTA